MLHAIDHNYGYVIRVGLAGVADSLAELIAPGVTARMTRVRFVTAMAVALP